MDNAVKICYALLDFDSDFKMNPAQLRGFLAHLFAHIPEFHHHSDHSYHYPLIQYKAIDKKLAVIGVGEFADHVFDKISDLGHVTTKTQKIPLNNVQFKVKSYSCRNTSAKYRFTSPWIALNERNYSIYKKITKKEKKSLLERILVGNILSMLKGLGIFVDYKITSEISQFKSTQITAHDNRFAGIYAEFETNVILPEFLGLGKSVTKGFGAIKEIS